MVYPFNEILQILLIFSSKFIVCIPTNDKHFGWQIIDKKTFNENGNVKLNPRNSS